MEWDSILREEILGLFAFVWGSGAERPGREGG